MLFYFTPFFPICQAFFRNLCKNLFFYVNYVKIYLGLALANKNLITLKWAEVIMKLDRFGDAWPYHTTCECGAKFTVEFSSDMTAEVLPDSQTKAHFTCCPVCDKKIRVPSYLIPGKMLHRIPIVNQPYYHD